MEVRLTPLLMAELECAPDLSDPATLGCLLSRMRTAWATPTAWVKPGFLGHWKVWIYVNGKCQMLASYQTEAAALVAALEAAP